MTCCSDIISRSHVPGEISCSSLGQAALCPASIARGAYSEETEPSRRGSRIHEACATGDFSGLKNQEEIECAERCEEILYWDLKKDRDIAWERNELALGAELNNGLHLAGTIDWLALDSDGEILCADRKTGRVDPGPPWKNWQLLGYALLVHKRYGVDTVRCAIIQPLAYPSFREADFPGDMTWEQIESLIATVVARAKNPDAEAVPSFEACEYCPARETGDCPEFEEWVATQVIPFDAEVAPVKEPGELTDAKLGDLMDIVERVEQAAKLCKSIRAEAIKRGGVPGWMVEEKPGRRAVKDYHKARHVLSEYIDPSTVVTETIKISDLQKVWRDWYKRANPRREDGKKTTDKDADAALEGLGLIDRGENIKSLVREEN